MTATTQKLLEEAGAQFARAINTIYQATGRIAEAEAVYERLMESAGEGAEDVHLHSDVTGNYLTLRIQITQPLEKAFELILNAGLVVAGSESHEATHGNYTYIHTTIHLHGIDVDVSHCECIFLAANDQTAHEALPCAA